MYRSNQSQMFFKIGVLKNFGIFTGKHLRGSLFLNKAILTQVFSCEYSKIFNNSFLERIPTVATFISPLPRILNRFHDERDKHLNFLTFNFNLFDTVWKVSKYGVFSGPCLDTFHAVWLALSNSYGQTNICLIFLKTLVITGKNLKE